MRGLEYYELKDDDQLRVIVNVTNLDDTSEVRNLLGDRYHWESSSVTVMADEPGEDPSEWMTLHGVSPRATSEENEAAA